MQSKRKTELPSVRKGREMVKPVKVYAPVKGYTVIDSGKLCLEGITYKRVLPNEIPVVIVPLKLWEEMRKALKSSKSYLTQLNTSFNSNNFTDRYDDKTVSANHITMINKALADTIVLLNLVVESGIIKGICGDIRTERA